MEGGDIILTPDLGAKTPNPFVDFIKKSWLIVLDIIIIVIISILFILKSLKSSTIILLIAPSSATVSIDNKIYPTNGAFNLFPGTHNVKISADNLQTKEFTLTLRKNSIQKLYSYLEQTDNNISFYISNPAEGSLLSNFNNSSDYLDTFYSYQDSLQLFLSKLPFAYSDQNNKMFIISKGDAENELVMTNINNASIDDVENFIRTNNLDPQNFSITIKDLPKDNSYE